MDDVKKLHPSALRLQTSDFKTLQPSNLILQTSTLGTLLEHLHELNVHFRGVEEHI